MAGNRRLDRPPAPPTSPATTPPRRCSKTRLRDALTDLNPRLPADALDDAIRKLARPDGATVEVRNRSFHRTLVNGVEIEYRDDNGAIQGDAVQVLDFDSPDRNDFLAVNQFTVTENRNVRRADIVLFVNGLPLGVIELKNPADENATIWTAWNQLQTYKSELPTLFSMNEALVGLGRHRGARRNAHVRAGSGSSLGAQSPAPSWRTPMRPSFR